ncbi:MAG: hypothetical protein ACYDIB_07390 [Desulfobulbia bacterium]
MECLGAFENGGICKQGQDCQGQKETCFKGERSLKTTPVSPSKSSDLLSCKRWNEAEVVALEKMMNDENADDSPLASSMRKNFLCKITQHETFIKALAAVTT